MIDVSSVQLAYLDKLVGLVQAGDTDLMNRIEWLIDRWNGHRPTYVNLPPVIVAEDRPETPLLEPGTLAAPVEAPPEQPRKAVKGVQPKSGYIGVRAYYTNVRGQTLWEVDIYAGDSRTPAYRQRGFTSAEEAARHYDEMALQLKGPGCRLNFPDGAPPRPAAPAPDLPPDPPVDPPVISAPADADEADLPDEELEDVVPDSAPEDAVTLSDLDALDAVLGAGWTPPVNVTTDPREVAAHIHGKLWDEPRLAGQSLEDFTAWFMAAGPYPAPGLIDWRRAHPDLVAMLTPPKVQTREDEAKSVSDALCLVLRRCAPEPCRVADLAEAVGEVLGRPVSTSEVGTRLKSPPWRLAIHLNHAGYGLWQWVDDVTAECAA